MSFQSQQPGPDRDDSPSRQDIVPRCFNMPHSLGSIGEPSGEARSGWTEADEQLAKWLEQVPVPAERRRRILSQLGRTTWVVPKDSFTSERSTTPHDADRAVPPVGARGRRRVFWTFALIASAACVLVAGHFLWRDPWDRVSPAQLVTLAAPHASDPRWQRVQFDDQGVYPVSSFLRSSPVRWQALEHPLDPKAIRYQLAAPTRDTYLYVLRPGRTVAQLPSLPPEQPQATAGAQRVAAWQEGAFVYVLAMRDGTADYWDVVRKRSGSVARTRGRRASS